MISPSLFLLPFAFLLQDPAPAIDRLRSLDASVRQAAERELSAEGAKAVPALRRALARETDPVDPRVDALVKKLSAPTWKERDEATRALVHLGRAARPRLATHEGAADVEVAWRVKSVLVELKELEPGEAAGSVFRDAAICRLLGAAGDGASAGAILAALAGTEGAPAEGVLDLRLSVLAALADLRGSLTAEQAERATEEGLKLAGESRHRRTTGFVLKAVGRLKSPSAVAPLAAILEDAAVKDIHVKRGAMAALAALDQPASMKAVAGVLKSADPYLREAALQVLVASGAPEAGIDSAAGPASDESFAKIRAWWEKKYGRTWDSESR